MPAWVQRNAKRSVTPDDSPATVEPSADTLLGELATRSEIAPVGLTPASSVQTNPAKKGSEDVRHCPASVFASGSATMSLSRGPPHSRLPGSLPSPTMPDASVQRKGSLSVSLYAEPKTTEPSRLTEVAWVDV